MSIGSRAARRYDLDGKEETGDFRPFMIALVTL
jgi:hypothetical protein